MNVRYPSPTLPSAVSLTDLLLKRDAPLPRRIDPSLRRNLALRLAPLAPQRTGGSISLNSFSLIQAIGDEHRSWTPFAWSPRTTRRILGLAAVQRIVSGTSATPTSAVRTEIDDAIKRNPDRPSRPGSLGQWLAETPSAALAIVVAEAVSYATDLLVAFDWNRLTRHVAVGSADAIWAVPGAPWVTLKGRRDLIVDLPTDELRCLVAVRNGRPNKSSLVDLAHVALVDGLTRPDKAHAQRVVGYWPTTGRSMSLEVDSEALKFAARNVVSALERLSDPPNSLQAA